MKRRYYMPWRMTYPRIRYPPIFMFCGSLFSPPPLLRNFNLMPRLRTYGKWIGALVILLVLAQLGLPFLLRTHRMRTYLLSHLQRSFGRPVEARSFSMDILPFPRVDVEGVSINENPSFAHEYFLPPTRLTPTVLPFHLLRAHFNFSPIPP